MRRLVALLIASFLAFSVVLVASLAPVGAETYPSRQIRIFVPYSPGGVSDIAARLVGQKLSDALGQAVIVENRVGGNGVVAMSAVVRAPADGYTLIVGTIGEFAINPALYKDFAYEVGRDMRPVAMLSDTPLVLAANGDAPYHSVKEVIAAAKAKPDAIGTSSPGAGTFNHIVIEQLGLRAGIKLLHVPYRGGAPAAAAVAAGDVPLSVLAISSAVPFLQSGRIRVLAVTTAKRSSFNPDWKTLEEEGVPDLNASNWVGMFAAKDVPDSIVEKLHDEIQKILAMPEIRERFAVGGAETTPMSIADFDARIKSDTASFKKIVAEAGIHVE
jgi:tripartite-type tricarboxylate transporter receptor subunit TctC